MVVVNLAAHFVAEHAPEDLEPLVDGNLRLPALILEAAALSGVAGVVSAGSFWEERSEHDSVPVNLYAAMKRASKELLRYYTDAYGWRSFHVRLTDVYGPKDPRRKLFCLLREAARSGVPLPMSPGEQWVDLVHVSDAARALATAVESAAYPDEAMGVLQDVGAFSGRPLPLREVVSTYTRVVGRPVPVLWGGRPYRQREVMMPHTVPNVPKWSASVGLEEGIREMEAAPGGLLAS